MYFIFIEKQKIPCAQSVLEAVSVMVATYWIFNIEFPIKIRKIMQFIAAISGIKSQTSIVVKRLLNEL